MARDPDCECNSRFTCGHCLRKAAIRDGRTLPLATRGTFSARFTNGEITTLVDQHNLPEPYRFRVFVSGGLLPNGEDQEQFKDRESAIAYALEIVDYLD